MKKIVEPGGEKAGVSISLPYIEPHKARQYTYFVVPKVLLTDPAFAKIDCTAKIIYSLMLSRLSLSAENPGQYTDAEGRLYIVYSVDEIADTLQISRPTVVKMITQLNNAGLIEKKRQGQGKPTLYYVMDFTAALEKPTDFQNSKFLTSRSKKSEILEFKNFNPSNNDLKNNDCSNNNPSFMQVQEGMKEGAIPFVPDYSQDDLEDITQNVKDSIEYDVFEEKWGQEIAQYVLSLIVGVLTRTGPVTMGGNEYPEEVVKKRYRSLKFEDVDLALEKLFANPDVRNQNAYLRTLLYNAPGSSELEACALVARDFTKYHISKTGTDSGFFNA